MSIARRTGHLERGGERLYYEVCGEGGTPLVLSHGAGGNHAVWYQQVAHFARSRAVVSWDHRGFGRSTDASDCSGPETGAADLGALLDHLGLERVDLVGQSMGGWSALGVTLAHPERVRRLVLADTLGGLVTPAVRKLLPNAAPGGDALAAAGELGRHPALDDAFGERDPAAAHLYQMLGGFGEPALARIIPALLTHEQPADAVAALSVPVLFVVGARDGLFPPKLVAEVATLIPGARVVEIPGCGHSPYFESPDAWNDTVGAFLDEA